MLLVALLLTSATNAAETTAEGSTKDLAHDRPDLARWFEQVFEDTSYGIVRPVVDSSALFNAPRP